MEDEEDEEDEDGGRWAGGHGVSGKCEDGATK